MDSSYRDDAQDPKEQEPARPVGPDGQPLPWRRTVLLWQASAALAALTDFERGLVMCWYCRHCNRYVGPGDFCHCCQDE